MGGGVCAGVHGAACGGFAALTVSRRTGLTLYQALRRAVDAVHDQPATHVLPQREDSDAWRALCLGRQVVEEGGGELPSGMCKCAVCNCATP